MPSFLLIIGSALFLLITLRAAGPSGTGVSAMLEMQSNWQNAPNVHASGRISEAGSLRSRFEIWRSIGARRRVELRGPGGAIQEILLLLPDRGWKWTADSHTWRAVDPDKTSADPVPDPDSGDGTFYRWVKVWTLEKPTTIGAAECKEVVGERPGARFTFYLEVRSKLPRRVILELQDPPPGRSITVDYDWVQLPPRLPDSLFSRTVSAGLH